MLAVALVGCTAEPVDPGDPTPIPLEPCDPALSLNPDAALAELRGFVQLTGSGGTGEHRFSLETNSSGGEINPETGAYLAGAEAGVDRIGLRDVGCGGEAFAEVEVIAPLQVLPAVTAVPPETDVAIAVVGGSGEWSCALVVSGSGGSTSTDCAYRSGAADGVDVVRATDSVTGRFGEVRVEVSAGNELRVAGAGGFFVVDGSPATPRTVGGSGALELSVASGDVEVIDGRISATAWSLDDGVADLAWALAVERAATLSTRVSLPQLLGGR